MAIVALFNQRPGVGRTTTARNLLAAVALSGQRPWGIDLDPAADLSRAFGVAPPDGEETMLAFFRDQVPLSHVAHITRSGVVLCPGHPSLAEVERGLGKSFPAITRLRHAIREPGTATGPVVIDCPANLGALTLNAILAAHVVLVPVPPQAEAIAAAGAVDRALNALQRAVRQPLARKYVLTRLTSERQASETHDALATAVSPEDILAVRLADALPNETPADVPEPRLARPTLAVQGYEELMSALGATAEARV